MTHFPDASCVCLSGTSRSLGPRSGVFSTLRNQVSPRTLCPDQLDFVEFLHNRFQPVNAETDMSVDLRLEY